MDRISEYLQTSEIIDMAKRACYITRPNNDMDEDDIRAVMHWVGIHAPDTTCTKGDVRFRRTGIDMMLTLTLNEFPRFYMRHSLSQWN